MDDTNQFTKEKAFRVSGFERLPMVRKSLGIIHGLIKSTEFRSGWENFNAPRHDISRGLDLITVQRFAKTVAGHYGIDGLTFVISFNSALDSVACVTVTKAREVFIEYNYVAGTPIEVVWTVLSHEIAHIFLHRLDLDVRDTLQNEVLTDTTAIYLGFGSFFLSSQRTEVNYIGSNQTQTTTRTIGYISPDEIGYILAQRDHLKNTQSFDLIKSETGKTGYRNGVARFQDEIARRPYVKRSLFQRLIRRCGWILAREQQGIIFDCFICKQAIRIPALHQTLQVKCPNCRERIRCYS